MTPTPLARTLARAAAVLALSAFAAACGGKPGEAAQGGQPPAAGTGGETAKAVAEVAMADGPLLVVHKTTSCGCCRKWVEHMQAAGFRVEVHDVEDAAELQPVKTELGVPGHLSSCHTAKVGGYALEGHIPADVVKRLLQEKPAVAGLAVPGMPMGSPGMEGPYSERYDIVAFRKDGQTSVYASK